MRKHMSLPYTYRPGLTVDHPKYRARVRCDIEQLRQTGGQAESITRLECVLGRESAGSGNFEIDALNAADGQILNISKWLAPDPKHVVVYLNGLESHAGWFSAIARALTQHDTAVYAVDRRGSGLNTRAAGTYHDWISDVACAVAKARESCPRAKIHVASLCFGAAVATGVAIENPNAVDSLVYMSPGLHVRVHPNGREMLRIAFSTLPGFTCNVPSPVRIDEMFTESGQALWFIYRDKLRTVAPRARDFVEARKILVCVLARLPEVDIPSVVFLAGKDRVVDNDATREAFHNLSRRPRIVEYPDSDHIIFFGSARDQLVSDILDFIT